MDKRLMPYYLSRVIIALGFGALFYASGSSLLMAAAISGTLIALFLWAPLSGWYAVHPEFGATALRRYECTQAINDKAARNAFVICMLATGAASIYYASAGMALIPTGMLRILLLLGIASYYFSDLWLRRTQANE